MGYKVAGAALVIGVLVVAAIRMGRHSESAVASGAMPAEVVPQTEEQQKQDVPDKKEIGQKVKAPSGTEAADDSPVAKHKEYVEQRSNELMDLAFTDDKASLDIILSELTNRDPEIRKAAVEAAVQFASRDAIPKMLEAADQLDNPKEKAEVLEAVEFLKLPSVTELAQGKPKVRAKTKISR